MRKSMRSLWGMVAILAWALGAGTPAGAVDLTASHQFPEDDIRHLILAQVARDIAPSGIHLRIFPDTALMAPMDQWAALTGGRLDMTLLPVDYVTRLIPELGVLSLPGVVVSHGHAARLSRSPVMAGLRGRLESMGVVVLADLWVAGSFGSVGSCLTRPEDAKGKRVRSSGWGMADLWRAAGAEPVHNVASDTLHQLLGSRLIAAVDTSSPSMLFYHLHERLDCLAAPGEAALWFLYEPLLVSRKSFDALTPAQRQALVDAGDRAQNAFPRMAQAGEDQLVATFSAAGVTVTRLTDADLEPWIALARQSVWKSFARSVPDGAGLVERVRAVP